MPIVVGAVAWSAAGTATSAALRPTASRERLTGVALAWAVGYLIALALGQVFGTWVMRHPMSGATYPGFVGVAVAWGLGAAAAALVGFGLVGSVIRSALLAPLWGAGFLVGAYVAVVFAYVLSQLFKNALQEMLGWQAPALGGWGLGYLAAGLPVAAALY